MNMHEITMPITQSLNIAFIGGAVSSAVGHTHFNASRLDGHFRVVAGCFSRDVENNEKTAHIYGVSPQRTYTNWLSLLDQEREQLDAVVILTPTPSHVDIVIVALESGYNVICEKALGTSSEECQRIIDARNKFQQYLAVTFNYSGYPMVRELRRMISEGLLGTLHQIHIEMPQEGYLRDNANPQYWRRCDYAVPTVSLDLGVHVHHLIDFLSNGLKPVLLSGEQASYGKFRGIIDNVYCFAQYEKNLRVQAWWGKTALGYRNGLRVRVFGDKASAEWYQMKPEDLKWADNEGRQYSIDRGSCEAKTAQETRYNRFKAGHPSGFIEAFANLYADIAEDVREFKAGKKPINPFVYSAEKALEGLSMMESINNAAIKKLVNTTG